ncbi:putative methyltransferase [Nocardia brasiliensis NBRC 14402]|uniref:methyltransferase domain-containing protein n=1 Tax=Nocardia brasiliensis TaxID=37326 RepID=UPI0002E83D84|nr:methyltransferase domain-containing protein [Nocardia brasiliensis]ASF10592.1 SAM-dependent methyltransferase [Nocardia brasiliensis]GAJ80536.1 putative methyltransferase [Nocardia brasiliensis NBRC 14402]SUB10869.1 Demethylmenaquinone methyltransferase [Nocardia brasiliensis]
MDTYTLRPDRFDRAGQDQLVDVRDLQAALPGIRRLRTWAQDALALRPGERAVDIGSGTGSEVLAFADAVGADGVAVGVEPDPNLLASAERRAAQAGSIAKFHSGDAYGLPFGADSFDAALCERVFQHLTAPARAANEIARVLRPGGRVVVVDSDWGTAIVHPGERSVVREVIDTLVSATTNPFSGRRLPGQLTKAGLVIDEIGSHALVQDRTVGAGSLVNRISAMAVARGVITEEQRDRLLEDLEAGAASGDIHLSVTMFAVLAHKPE